MTREEIQQNALVATSLKRRCGLGVTMGGGKTLIGLLHMDNILKTSGESNIRFLIVAPKKSIFISWEDEAKKHKLSHLLGYIDYTTYISLSKQSLDYACIYLDECHSLLYSHDFWLKSYYGRILGLTGTPPRFLKSEKGVMVNQYCPIVYEYITEDAIDHNILNDYRIVLHHLKLDVFKTIEKTNKNTGGKWYTSEADNYGYWTKQIFKYEDSNIPVPSMLRINRMRALMETPSKVSYAKTLLNDTSNKVLVFANTQEQAETLCEHSYHSKNPDNEKNLILFKNGVITKLSSVMQLNEGVNIPYLREGIILHAYSNERKSSQRLGRLLRLNTDDVALIHILVFDKTVDEQWTADALKDFNQEKIFHYYPKTVKSNESLLNCYGESIENIEFPWGNFSVKSNQSNHYVTNQI